MVRLRRTLFAASAGLALAIGVLGAMSMWSSRPDNLGVHAGKLAPCPGSPNCVSTQATDSHAIDPIRLTTDRKTALETLKAVVGAMPRTHIVTENADYLHFEFTSWLFRFVDDVEFYLDSEAGLIHFRSASRTGRSDFGVNRKRMESIRKSYNDKLAKSAP